MSRRTARTGGWIQAITGAGRHRLDRLFAIDDDVQKAVVCTEHRRCSPPPATRDRLSAVYTADLNLTPKDISHLALIDAVARWLTMLGYDTSRRKPLTPESIGLAAAIKRRE